MEDGSSLPLWGAVLLLLLFWLNGIFYGFAAAVQNLSENEVEKRAREGDKKYIRLLEMIRHPARYINAIPLIVLTSGMCCGSLLAPWAAHVFQPYIRHLPALVLVLAVCVILLASLGILTFRRVGAQYPEKFACRYFRVVYGVSGLLHPVTLFVTWIARMAAKPFGVDISREEKAVTEEEIISIVDEAHEQGVIEESEAEMIQNIISLNDTEAGDIMTHRKNVAAFEQDSLLQEVVDRMLEEGNSRYPVYKENVDNIVGLIHYKDALKFITKNPWAKFKPLKELPGLIREAVLVPETRGIGDLFGTMQAKKLHMAVVVDEYGQTAGIISMEDILEEIVGDILDEYDEEETTIRTQVDNSVIIDGMAGLEDVEDELGVDFGDVDYGTLNGFLTAILGHIPTEEDLDRELHTNGYRFTILSLGNKTIGKVRAEKTETETEKETKGEEKCQDIQNSQT